MRGARVLIVNEYEYGMIRNKTGLPDRDLQALPQVTIITRGEAGSTIYLDNAGRRDSTGTLVGIDPPVLEVPVVPPQPLAEPTGVGDGYRAGLIKGLLRGYDWATVGRIAALAATYVLEQFGTQNHHYTLPEFVARYRQVFGPAPELADW
jgi:adenosine kinase